MYFLLKYNNVRTQLFAISLLAVIGFSNSLYADDLSQTQDPWVSVNKQVFIVNDYFDQLLLQPISSSYMLLTPAIIRRGISNFFNNVQDINIAANNFLQLKFEQGISDSTRVIVNSTVGFVGLFDIASGMGLLRHEEDFGQTLGVWGVGTGPYIFLPVFGASNLRDSLGLIVDTAFNPIQYHDEIALKFILYFIDQIDFRSSLLAYDQLISGDRYLFVREAYVQNRNFVINDGEGADSFGEF